MISPAATVTDDDNSAARRCYSGCNVLRWSAIRLAIELVRCSEWSDDRNVAVLFKVLNQPLTFQFDGASSKSEV